MKKRMVVVLLLMCMMFSLISPAAAEVNSEIGQDVLQVFGAGESVEPYGPKYHYKSEFLIKSGDHSTIVEYDECIAGQPTMGTYVSRNSSLFYTVTGGGSKPIPISIGVTATLPGNYKALSVNVTFDLGAFKAPSGGLIGGSQGLEDDQEPGYYHLHLLREKVIRPYVVYYKLSGSNDDWKVSHTGYVLVDDNYRLTAHLVDPEHDD